MAPGWCAVFFLPFPLGSPVVVDVLTGEKITSSVFLPSRADRNMTDTFPLWHRPRSLWSWIQHTWTISGDPLFIFRTGMTWNVCIIKIATSQKVSETPNVSKIFHAPWNTWVWLIVIYLVNLFCKFVKCSDNVEIHWSNLLENITYFPF